MTSSRPVILVADDQPDVLESLRLLLKAEGFGVELAGSPSEVETKVGRNQFDALLMDLNYSRDTTSGKEGLELLTRLRDSDESLPIVVMTAWGSIEVAVEAMRRGARDFVEKQWDNERLLSIVRTQVELARALRKGERLEAENRVLRGDSQTEFIAESKAMQPVLELIERVGPSDANILITGENGTGKGIVARLLHAVSPRSEKAMVTVNTGGLSETLFESELFGHVKGAFTDAKSDRVGRFEMAADGTLFLDEIGNLPPTQQAKLLRVVETGEFERVGSSRTRRVDTRVLSATNADLDKEVAEERFRKDLLYRLRTVEIRIPPLRDRRGDIEPLAMHFLAIHLQRYRKQIVGFGKEALQALERHGWPGNVRELDHAVERGVLMAREEMIDKADLGLESKAPEAGDLEAMQLDDAEKFLISRALERRDGSVSQAARDLGVSRSALYRRLEKYDLGQGQGRE